jgi:uncharacterized protein (TIGR03790 family)
MKKNIQKNRTPGAKVIKKICILSLFICQASVCLALEPAQILIIANSDVNESVQLAKYYCQQRAVPQKNILKVSLGKTLSEYITRQNYDNILAPAIKNEIRKNRKPDEIRCLLTVYGVPIKVSAAAPSPNSAQLGSKLSEMYSRKEVDLKTAYQKLNQLGRKEMVNPNNIAQPKSCDDILKSLDNDVKETLNRIKYVDEGDLRNSQYDELLAFFKLVYGSIYASQQAKNLPGNTYSQSLLERSELYKNDRLVKRAQDEKWSIAKKIDENFYPAIESIAGLRTVIANLKSDMDRCQGKETGASVDSELSMVLFENYDLYRWQPNELKDSLLFLPSDTLMVCRLDGPSEKIAAGLIDKAIYAEKNGLSGTAYVDARGMNITGELSPYSYEYYDRNLNSLVKMLKSRVTMPVVFENTSKLFAEGQCPQTALYCGWYSVKRYIDAFDFVPGAIGFHIASFEAMDLRNASSLNWCPAMLADGITATMGPVDEPYLHSFPLPTNFFAELLDGKSLVEAYYRTNPYNSWQMVLIGDPLYKINIK